MRIELAECPALAEDEDMDEPSDIAIAKAEQFLEEVSHHVSERPDIYHSGRMLYSH